MNLTEQSRALVEVQRWPVAKPGWMARFSGGRHQAGDRAGTWVASVPSGEDTEWLRWGAGDRAAWSKLRAGASLFRVVDGPFDIELRWSKLAVGRAGSVDVVVRCRMRVADPVSFVREVATERCASDAPLDSGLLETWVRDRIGRRGVEAELDRYSVDAVLDRDPLPGPWWRGRLAETVEDVGLAVVDVADVAWSSPRVDAARMEEEERLRLTSIERRRALEREHEVARARAEAEHQAALKAIERDAVRQQELEVAHRVALVKAEAAWLREQRAVELEALEHEKRVAEMKRDVEQVARIDRRQSEVRAEQASAISAWQRLAELPPAVWSELTEQDPVRRHAAAERLVAEQGIGASLLAWLGVGVGNQLLLQHLRDRGHGDGAVRLEKPDLLTRTIGTRKVEALPVNTSLLMRLTSGRPGFLTLINFGTSGELVLHTPSAFVAPERAWVEADRAYEVPGSHLLPWEALRSAGLDYVEVGPPGWEHMVAIVSARPLLGADGLAGVTLADPFAAVGAEALFDALTSLDVDDWTAGTLSFLVE